MIETSCDKFFWVAEWYLLCGWPRGEQTRLPGYCRNLLCANSEDGGARCFSHQAWLINLRNGLLLLTENHFHTLCAFRIYSVFESSIIYFTKHLWKINCDRQLWIFWPNFQVISTSLVVSGPIISTVVDRTAFLLSIQKHYDQVCRVIIVKVENPATLIEQKVVWDDLALWMFLKYISYIILKNNK